MSSKPKLNTMPESAERPIGQRAAITMPDLGAQLDAVPAIEAIDKPMLDEQFDALAFNEEWIDIYVNPVPMVGAPAAKWVPCAVQGRNPEVLIGGKAVMWPIPYLPAGQLITTRRKYVEALLLSRVTTVVNEVDMHEGEDRNPTNRVRYDTAQACTVAIRRDGSKYAGEWLNRVMAQAV